MVDSKLYSLVLKLIARKEDRQIGAQVCIQAEAGKEVQML